jgi:hypothetical protein
LIASSSPSFALNLRRQPASVSADVLILELIDPLPPMIKLFWHISQLVSKSGFRCFTPLLKIELDSDSRLSAE